MSHRSELEDKQTVECLGCNTEWVEPNKKPGQKYPKRCPGCGRTNKNNQKLARKRYVEFLAKLKVAWEALGECKVHREAGPGYRGLQENLWQLAGFESELEFLKAIYPGYPHIIR